MCFAGLFGSAYIDQVFCHPAQLAEARTQLAPCVDQRDVDFTDDTSCNRRSKMALAAARTYHSRHHRGDDDHAYYGMFKKRTRASWSLRFVYHTYPMQNSGCLIQQSNYTYSSQLRISLTIH
jgi:hypothetical protein